MPNYHRYYIPDSIIFITSVTKDRTPYLQSKTDIDLFFDTLGNVKRLYPFHLLAYVILPDHFHWLMNMKKSTNNFSDVIRSIKRNFTLNYKNEHNILINLSVWQERFWDHVIRDERDLENHFDYIHWNPVKHGFVKSPQDWNYSTYQFWQKRGYYPTMSENNLEIPQSVASMDYE